MLKGLALTPPVIGRISIGKVVLRQGQRWPEKDDEFTLTSQIQTRDGWIVHPLDGVLRQAAPGAKLRSLAVRLLFDDPQLNLRVNYTLFEPSTGRPLCVGDGESCRRSTASGVQSLPCPSPQACALGLAGQCKPYARLHVCLGDDDELGCFVLRSTGLNSIRTLSARLRYLQAASGGLLSALALQLRLRGKSTVLSQHTPIYYVDLTLRCGDSLIQAVQDARAWAQARQDAGVDQAALDEAARAGFAMGAFEESPEEGVAVLDEFYALQSATALQVQALVAASASGEPVASLVDKLRQKSQQSAAQAL